MKKMRSTGWLKSIQSNFKERGQSRQLRKYTTERDRKRMNLEMEKRVKKSKKEKRPVGRNRMQLKKKGQNIEVLG